MRVTYETAGENTEARLSDNADDLIGVALVFERGFSVQWIKKLNGLDQSYWDCSVRGVMLTLHREHYLGVSLFPAREETDLRRANELVVEIGTYFQQYYDRQTDSNLLPT